MNGKIIKGIAGFYYVYAEDGILYECRGRGILRQKKITPLVGDNVVISVEDAGERKGSLEEILPRKNSLIRPAVANIDQALIVFAKTDPVPNMGLLDRLLIGFDKAGIKSVIAFNKSDLKPENEEEFKEEIKGYEAAGIEVREICVRTGEGTGELKELLKGKATALAGPSGVGKSSFTNLLCPRAAMEVGEISEKLSRGKHTTRHAQIFVVDTDTFIFDTPGFTSYEIGDIEADDLDMYYPEYAEYIPNCRFTRCSHTHEPGCAVRNAVDDGILSSTRYERYVKLYEELKNRRKY